MTEENENKKAVRDEIIDFAMISDSTSVLDVITFVEKHTDRIIDDETMFRDIDDFIHTPVPQREEERDALAKEGLALLKRFNHLLNVAANGLSAVHAKYSICRGQIFLHLKRLVKKAGQSWEQWATSNVPFVSQRTRIDNMRLARRQDCYPYFILGSERLLMVARATEAYSGDDKIGDFMRKHGIKFDPESRDELRKFKLQVDAALNRERLEKVNVEADPHLVKVLTRYIPALGADLLMTSKAIAESGGDVNEHFKKLIINKGKEKSPFEINKAIADFNSSGAKLLQIIEYILKNEDTVETLNAEIVTDLTERLVELKNFANIE